MKYKNQYSHYCFNSTATVLKYVNEGKISPGWEEGFVYL